MSAERNTFLKLNVSSSFNVECRVPSRQLECSNGVCKFQKHSTYSTYSTFPRKDINILLRKVVEHIQHIQHVRRKKHIFGEMLLSAVVLNVGSLSGNWGVQKGSESSKNIQHIQRVQHFPRKKHFFEQVAFNCGIQKMEETQTDTGRRRREDAQRSALKQGVRALQWWFLCLLRHY